MSEINAVTEYYKRAVSVMSHLDPEAAIRIVDQIAAAISQGGKVLICGNGGSAADASHLAGELVGRFRRERSPIPAIALTTDPSVLTALGNDYGYSHVFRRQVEALGNAGDVLIAISTSGTSPNVLQAAEAARNAGMKVVAFTSSSCDAAKWADIHWQASCPETSHAQEQMLIAFHAVCQGLEDVLADQS